MFLVVELTKNIFFSQNEKSNFRKVIVEKVNTIVTLSSYWIMLNQSI